MAEHTESISQSLVPQSSLPKLADSIPCFCLHWFLYFLNSSCISHCSFSLFVCLSIRLLFSIYLSWSLLFFHHYLYNIHVFFPLTSSLTSVQTLQLCFSDLVHIVTCIRPSSSPSTLQAICKLFSAAGFSLCPSFSHSFVH